MGLSTGAAPYKHMPSQFGRRGTVAAASGIIASPLRRIVVSLLFLESLYAIQLSVLLFAVLVATASLHAVQPISNQFCFNFPIIIITTVLSLSLLFPIVSPSSLDPYSLRSPEDDSRYTPAGVAEDRGSFRHQSCDFF